MLDLPQGIISVIRWFEPVFSERVWEWAKVLMVGAILAPGKRTVTSALRVMGLSDEAQYQNYHRVLNRAVWSSRGLSERLLQLVIAAFVAPDASLVLGLDDHIERRRGEQIAAKGIYREAVRAQGAPGKSFFVKTSGLGWVSMMGLTKIPWVGCVWALPFLTVLAPSERYHAERSMQPKKITDWVRQMIRQVRRWLPDHKLIVVMDSSDAVLALLATCGGMRQPVTVVTRLRLDAALYDPAPARQAGQRGAPRKKGARQPSLAQRIDDPATAWQPVTVHWDAHTQRPVELASGTAVWSHPGLPTVPLRWVLIRDPWGKFATQALLCTDLNAIPAHIVEWFVLRWQLEVTFQAARTHLGIETQRQGSDLAIRRTTPALLALFSLVTLFAHHLLHGQSLPVRQAAWYQKSSPTFSDTLAFVRQHLWPVSISYLSPSKPDMLFIPKLLFNRLTDPLAFAA